MTANIEPKQLSSLSMEMYQSYFESKVVQSEDSIAYSEKEYQRYDKVSLNTGTVSPMGLFFNQIKSSFADHFDRTKPETSPPYPDGIESASGLAGKILKKIENRLFSAALQLQAKVLQGGPPASHTSEMIPTETLTLPAPTIESPANENAAKSEIEETELSENSVADAVAPSFNTDDVDIDDKFDAGKNETIVAADENDVPPDTNQVETTTVPANQLTNSTEQNLLTQFENGLETAFQETLTQLTEHFNAGATHTELYKANELISKGIQAFKDQTANAPVAASVFQEALEAHYHSEDLGLNIMTKDGDQISIAFHQTDQSANYAFRFSNPNQNGSGSGLSRSLSNGLAVVINGDLDEHELAAISDLIENVKNVADRFFGGDFESALTDAMEMGLNTDELAAYSLSMTSNKIDISAQHKMTRMTDKPNPTKLPLKANHPPKPFAAMIKNMLPDLQELFNQPVLKTLDKPDRVMRDLFKMIGEQRNKPKGFKAGHNHQPAWHLNKPSFKFADKLIKSIANPEHHHGLKTDNKHRDD